jgi:hypothetical protein
MIFVEDRWRGTGALTQEARAIRLTILTGDHEKYLDVEICELDVD